MRYFCKKEITMSKKSGGLSKLYIYHYLKLAFRIGLFVGALIFYIYHKVKGISHTYTEIAEHPIFWAIIWLFFAFGIILRFFPSKLETIGSQKHFKRNYVPTGEEKPSLTPNKSLIIFTACWVLLNVVLGGLYLLGVYDAGVLILVTLLYSVIDIMCILFFCPIRDWFLKNKCCTDCRIYNWDYAMMFTPFIFLPHIYTWSLFGLSLALLLTWEIMFKLHPERFAKNTNACLECHNCKEKPCRHKKRIARILQNSKEKLQKLSWWKQKK